MVEPLDAQNMLSRTPLVEKTAAAERNQAVQFNDPRSQLEREKTHENENVQLKHEVVRLEEHEEEKRRPKPQARDKRPPASRGNGPEVELVQESADTPRHQVDITL